VCPLRVLGWQDDRDCGRGHENEPLPELRTLSSRSIAIWRFLAGIGCWLGVNDLSSWSASGRKFRFQRVDLLPRWRRLVLSWLRYWLARRFKENPGFWSSCFRCFQRGAFLGGRNCGINWLRLAASCFAERRCGAQVLFWGNAFEFRRGKNAGSWLVVSGQEAGKSRSASGIYFADRPFRGGNNGPVAGRLRCFGISKNGRPTLPADCGSMVFRCIDTRTGGGLQDRVLGHGGSVVNG
jgi:hypothetical protein